MRTLVSSPICSVNTNCKAAFQENNATQQAELAHSIANTKKRPCKRETVQEKQHALWYKQRFMANGWHNCGNSDSFAAMHKVLGHLFVFIPLHKLVQQNWPWREREKTARLWGFSQWEGRANVQPWGRSENTQHGTYTLRLHHSCWGQD